MDAVCPQIPLPLASCPEWSSVLRSTTGGRSQGVPAGGTVFHQGQPRHGLVLVESGALTLGATTATGRRGILALLGPGQSVTESVGNHHGDTAAGFEPLWEVRAVVPTRVLEVRPADLRRATDRDPQLSAWLVSLAGRRADHLARTLARQLCLGLTDRLLDTLRDLSEHHGRAGPDGIAVDLPLTQDLLAAMVGGSRESVNRALRRLVAEGRIRRRGRTYVVPSGSSTDSA